MILENIKFKKLRENYDIVLRLFLALVFLTAGVGRIFIPGLKELEFVNLHLPFIFFWPLIIFELIVGYFLLINKYTKIIYKILILFLTLSIFWAFIINGTEIINSLKELFIFDLNPTDVFLHFVFLLIALKLLTKRK